MNSLTKDAFSSIDIALGVESVVEEYEWVAKHAEMYFGIHDAFPTKQRLVIRGERAYDQLLLEVPGVGIREYWFDITSFYQ
jgi:hypothetical protein